MKRKDWVRKAKKGYKKAQEKQDYLLMFAHSKVAIEETNRSEKGTTKKEDGMEKNKKNQAEKWFKEAERTGNWDSGFPEKTGTLEEGTVTVHEFSDGSEILSGHGTVWTREEYESL